MKKYLTVTVSMLAMAALSGPSAASLPCAKLSSDGVKLICYCQPGAAPGSERCRCNPVAVDESGVVVY